MISKQVLKVISTTVSYCIILAMTVAMALYTSSCGGSGGGDTHASPGSRVVGQVLVQNTALARMTNGKTAERSAAQVSGCSAVPTGYTAISNATINVSGMTDTTTTDSSGCFELTLKTSGVKVFTATKSNTAGGTTTLKKAVTMAQNSDLTFVASDAMTELTTIAAIIVEQKMANNESNIDPEATETYVATIQDQEDIQGLLNSIQAAADPDDSSVASFDAIDTSAITESEQTTDQPVIYSAAITGSPVAQSGGSISVTAKIAAYGSGVSITSANTTLAADGASSITIPMTLSSGITYSGSYTFPANDTGAIINYSATISAVDSNSLTGTYATSSFTVTHIGAYCGDGNIDTDNGETCDEGDNNATTCTPGASVGRVANAAPAGPSEQCSYCDSTTCQVVSVSWECGDGTLQTSIGEECDDGNILTEECDYGQTSCEVCRADCETVSGATSYCGDGTLHSDNGEECDDGGSNTDTPCTPPGAALGRLAASFSVGSSTPSPESSSCNYCNTSCESVTVETNCGDGILRTDLFEQCDDGGESATCNSDCTTASCGDGKINATAGETCDDSGESATCDSNCTAAACGDGVKNMTAGETCDDGNTTSNDGCSSTCQFEFYYETSAPSSNTWFGSRVATADVDGDGKTEFIFGAKQDNPSGNTNAGSVYVYDDDGATLLAQYDGAAAYENMGESVAAGDVDGDGKPEIIIGAWQTSPGGLYKAGSVYVYDDDLTTLLFQIDGAVESTCIGNSVAAGDVDGDGKAEIIIGAKNADPGGNTNAGGVYIYDDDGTTLLAQMDGANTTDNLGSSVASAGDVDADGKDEILIGVPGFNSSTGRAYLYDDDGITVLAQYDGVEAGSQLGGAVSSAGDVDGDGKAEILIGAPGTYNSVLGRAYLYDDNGTTLLAQIDGASNSDLLGGAVASAGDVDGDGNAEIAIGAYGSVNSVYLYDNDGATLLSQIEGPVTNGGFGISIASAGDLDADGNAEILIGAYQSNYFYVYKLR